MKNKNDELTELIVKNMKDRRLEQHRVRVVLSKKKEQPSKKVDWKAELEKDKN